MSDRNIFESKINSDNIEKIKNNIVNLCEVTIGQLDKKTVEYIYADGEHHCINSSAFVNSDMDKNIFISCLIASFARACNLLEVGEIGFDIVMGQCQEAAQIAYETKKVKNKERKK